MTPEEVARGGCAEGTPDAPPGPWTITKGKPLNSASPGFFMRDADGVRYLLKTDRSDQPEQGTAADAITAALFHAAGYFVPCNRVVYFDPEILVIDAEATVPRPGRSPTAFTDADLARVLSSAPERDGLRRAMLSRFIDGTPLGPWDYVGTRDGDLNDVVPHEHRRDLRGQHVLFAWVNHFDARQINTLSSWIGTPGGRGHVRHYLIDFGDSLGHAEPPRRRASRNGHTLWVDFGDIAADTILLGIVPRPWDDRERHPVLGYFDAEHFSPEGWRPHYWNGAMDRRTEADDAWMARILARFDREQVRAAVELGRFSDEAVTELLVTTLLARRDEILERYLTRLSPLADPAVLGMDDGSPRLCLRDLTVSSGIRDANAHRYEATVRTGEGEIAPLRVVDQGTARPCALLERHTGSRGGDEYRVIEVSTVADGDRVTGPLRVHLYWTDASGAQVVGLERPST